MTGHPASDLLAKSAPIAFSITNLNTLCTSSVENAIELNGSTPLTGLFG
jgi:hypothetical protein